MPNAQRQPHPEITADRTGAATATPAAAPTMRTAVGRFRSRCPNQPCRWWTATGAAGPSAAPSSTRVRTSVPNPAAAHTIGSWAADHSSAIPSSRTEVRTFFVRADTASAETEKSAKNVACDAPNSCREMPNSRMMSGPASPRTALSAKLTSMKPSSSQAVPQGVPGAVPPFPRPAVPCPAFPVPPFPVLLPFPGPAVRAGPLIRSTGPRP
nr:hypothetical protein [Streptomyces sp. DSM 40976]